jgi:ANTAR domain
MDAMTDSSSLRGIRPQPDDPQVPRPDSSEPPDLWPELAGLLIAAQTAEDVLDRVVLAARHAIPGADLVSITIREPDGNLRTPVETAPEATELDQAQYRQNSGPCVDAADPAGPAYVLSPDLSHETSWPSFTAAAIAHGYAAVLSTALLSAPEPSWFTGALNIYSRRAGGLDTDARDLAFLFATHASLALAGVRDRQDLAECREGAIELRKAIESRTVIGQATGILMARRGLTADEAFAVLSRTSQNHNIKLADLAGILTDRPDIAGRI